MTDRVSLTLARLALFSRYRSEGATKWLEATGTSMRPLVPPGSHLLVEFGRPEVCIGDVIVFESRGAITAHRVVARRGRGAGQAIITKGDSETAADPAIRPDDVLGIVRAVARPDGRTERLGPGGWRGVTAARISWWSARAARAGRSLAAIAPRRVRPAAMARIGSISRVPTRVFMASMPRRDRGRSAGRR